MATLFTLPIASTPSGTFTCTSPAPQIYLLTFTSPPDNRLTTACNTTFLLALDILEHRYPPGVLITTSGIPKFYSNGLDLDHVGKTDGFFEKSLHPLMARLLTYPMPTIALLNGHAFAGGMILAMHHDYRFQNPTKGFLCLNEILFGYPMPQPLLAAIREKVPPATLRSLVLEGHRFAAKQSLAEGLVDGLGGLKEVMDFVAKKELIKIMKTGAVVYGRMKESMYRSTLNLLRSTDGDSTELKIIDWEKQERRRKGIRRLEVWEKEGGKAKL